jgi:hypothetical protein
MVGKRGEGLINDPADIEGGKDPLEAWPGELPEVGIVQGFD